MPRSRSSPCVAMSLSDLNRWRLEVLSRRDAAETDAARAREAGDLVAAADADTEADLLYKLAQHLSWRAHRLAIQEAHRD